ncbi:MAG TPA: SDR family oxidoreductase [Tepidisphaeraceae bacterium]|nr:SDR family oxidoreductase [Tepidisphaeraceae bacterium]
MSDRVAIVTGAGRGIGRAAAAELSRRGYRLALVSRTRAELEETARLCAAGAAEVFAADVSHADQVDDLIERVASRFGRVDALIHAAGVAMLRSIEELSPAEWRTLIDTNLSAIYFFCRRLWPIWRRQGGGVVVNVSSVSARDPFAGLGAYGAAKAGVNLLGLALAREGAAIHVRVHTIAPGAVETAMLRSMFTHRQLPPENALDPADVARVIVQCVCGELACTSGEVIYVHR